MAENFDSYRRPESSMSSRALAEVNVRYAHPYHRPEPDRWQASELAGRKRSHADDPSTTYRGQHADVEARMQPAGPPLSSAPPQHQHQQHQQHQHHQPQGPYHHLHYHPRHHPRDAGGGPPPPPPQQHAQPPPQTRSEEPRRLAVARRSTLKQPILLPRPFPVASSVPGASMLARSPPNTLQPLHDVPPGGYGGPMRNGGPGVASHSPRKQLPSFNNLTGHSTDDGRDAANADEAAAAAAVAKRRRLAEQQDEEEAAYMRTRMGDGAPRPGYGPGGASSFPGARAGSPGPPRPPMRFGGDPQRSPAQRPGAFEEDRSPPLAAPEATVPLARRRGDAAQAKASRLHIDTGNSPSNLDAFSFSRHPASVGSNVARSAPPQKLSFSSERDAVHTGVGSGADARENSGAAYNVLQMSDHEGGRGTPAGRSMSLRGRDVMDLDERGYPLPSPTSRARPSADGRPGVGPSGAALPPTSSQANAVRDTQAPYYQQPGSARFVPQTATLPSPAYHTTQFMRNAGAGGAASVGAPGGATAGGGGESNNAAALPAAPRTSIPNPPPTARLPEHMRSPPSSKTQFLSLFSNFYDSLTDSRTLKATLEEQVRRSNTLLQTLQRSSRVLEQTVERRVQEERQAWEGKVRRLEGRVRELEERVGVPRRDSAAGSGDELHAAKAEDATAAAERDEASAEPRRTYDESRAHDADGREAAAAAANGGFARKPSLSSRSYLSPARRDARGLEGGGGGGEAEQPGTMGTPTASPRVGAMREEPLAGRHSPTHARKASTSSLSREAAAAPRGVTPPAPPQRDRETAAGVATEGHGSVVASAQRSRSGSAGSRA